MEHVIYVAWAGQSIGNVLLQVAEAGGLPQMRDVVGVAGDQVIQARNLPAFGYQAVAQMRAEESRSSGNDCVHSFLRTAERNRQHGILSHRGGMDRRTAECIGMETANHIGSCSTNFHTGCALEVRAGDSREGWSITASGSHKSCNYFALAGIQVLEFA
jgi:hypothetical protein